jgi:hypothetical protein
VIFSFAETTGIKKFQRRENIPRRLSTFFIRKNEEIE